MHRKSSYYKHLKKIFLRSISANLLNAKTHIIERNETVELALQRVGLVRALFCVISTIWLRHCGHHWRLFTTYIVISQVNMEYGEENSILYSSHRALSFSMSKSTRPVGGAYVGPTAPIDIYACSISFSSLLSPVIVYTQGKW